MPEYNYKGRNIPLLTLIGRVNYSSFKRILEDAEKEEEKKDKKKDTDST